MPLDKICITGKVPLHQTRKRNPIANSAERQAMRVSLDHNNDDFTELCRMLFDSSIALDRYRKTKQQSDLDVLPAVLLEIGLKHPQETTLDKLEAMYYDYCEKCELKLVHKAREKVLEKFAEIIREKLRNLLS